MWWSGLPEVDLGQEHMKRRAPIPEKGKKFLSSLALIAVTLAVVALLGVVGYIFYLLAKLPRVDRLADQSGSE